jgi:hypothetical protein
MILLVIAIMAFFILPTNCGTVIEIGYGNDDKLINNFGLCITLSTFTGGLVILAVFFVIKERKNINFRNKSFLKSLNLTSSSSDGKTNTLEKKRLPPTKETVMELFNKSGNRCTLYPCTNPLIDHKGRLRAQIISIISNEEEQYNYSPNLSNENRINIGNLMILCYDHFFDMKIKEKFSLKELMSKKQHAEKLSKEPTAKINDSQIEDLIQDYMKRTF